MRRTSKREWGGSECKRSELSVPVEEQGRKFTVSVSAVTVMPRKTHIDEKPFVNLLKCRCDYAIEILDKGVFFFVELKGSDIVKAAEQLAYTIANLESYRHLLDYSLYTSRHACIVSSQGARPAILTRYQVFKRKIECRGFKVKCKTRQLTANVDANGGVVYM